jgi:hypothetical protein
VADRELKEDDFRAYAIDTLRRVNDLANSKPTIVKTKKKRKS